MHQFLLMKDGEFEIVSVDNLLPLAPTPTGKAKGGGGGGGGGGSGREGGSDALKYCKSVERQLWAPLIEKAYAKSHGSYKAHERARTRAHARTHTCMYVFVRALAHTHNNAHTLTPTH